MAIKHRVDSVFHKFSPLSKRSPGRQVNSVYHIDPSLKHLEYLGEKRLVIKNQYNKKMEEYLNERVQKQRTWYEKKANKNKKRFISYQTVIIVLGAVIPVVVVFEAIIPGLDSYGGAITAVISAIIAIYAGLDKLKRPQPNWFNYRANEESIKKEEWLFKYKAGPYKNLSDEESDILLVERVESIISADITRMNNEKRREPEEEMELLGNPGNEKDN